MKVILLKDVAKLGRKSEVKTAADGFAHNFLIARGLAVAATPEALANLEKLQKQQSEVSKIEHDLLLHALETLKETKVTILAKGNADGNLFAGLKAQDIVTEVEKATRIKLDPSWLDLDKPIKTTGEHQIIIKAGGLTGPLHVVINLI